MGIYSRYILPHLVHFTCGQSPTMKQRQKVIPLAEGRVLEVGIGSGLNIPFYDTERVTHLWGLDPSREIWAIAERNAAEHRLETEFIEAGAEDIPLEDDSADTVVITYTLCTVPDVPAALSEVKRVLRPGGSLVFCEHGLAPDANIRKWQERAAPLWKFCGGGCHLNRPIQQMLEESGFRSGDMQTMYIPGWKPASFNYWGTARAD